MMNQSNLEDLLKSALEECERLPAENAHLQNDIGDSKLDICGIKSNDNSYRGRVREQCWAACT